jgi:hypothetical protein
LLFSLDTSIFNQSIFRKYVLFSTRFRTQKSGFRFDVLMGGNAAVALARWSSLPQDIHRSQSSTQIWEATTTHAFVVDFV